MQNLRKYLQSIPKNKWKIAVSKQKDWVESLKQVYPFSNCLNEQIYLLMNDLKEPPRCAVNSCNNSVNWLNHNHYTETCGRSCAQQLRKQKGVLSEIQEKIKATNIERYGVCNPTQNETVIAKRHQTLMKKYGALVSLNTRASSAKRAAEMNKKSKQTLQSRYGVSNCSQIPGVQEKKIQTMLENYGVHHASKIPHVQQRRQSRKIERYQNLSANAANILEWNLPSQHLQNLFENPNPRIKFECRSCNHVDEIAMETFRWRSQACGTPCAKCSNLNKGSLQEQQIKDYVKSLGIDFQTNDRLILHPLELDIWIPSHNLAIEYCGLYWHSELNNHNKNYHLNKMTQCIEKGIRLITIFEDEWLHRPQVVKDRIKNLLGLNYKRIGARKLICKKISKVLANRFCADYHVQGVGKTMHAYGLYHNNDLVSVMTFSCLSPAKGSLPQSNVWELNRFCSKPDLSIPGGASKMFRNFVNDHDPQMVISYSDRRWNTGRVYQQLAFDLLHHSQPNYWYIDFKSMTRIHRYNLRKNNRDNIQLTEWENRQLQGWNRIWDCGHSKWVWTKKAE